MGKKTLIALLSGVLIAAIVCIVVGLIIYIPAANLRLDSAAADFSTLSQQRSAQMALGSLILIVGCSAFVLPAAALIVLMIIYAVSAFKNGKK